jgi:hypothetical protein
MIRSAGFPKTNLDLITGYWKKQVFVAAANQKDFVVTNFTLKNNFLLFLNDVYQSENVTRVVNTISFAAERNEGDKVTVYGIDSPYVVLSKQKFIATAGQQAFTITDFALSQNYLIIVDDILQSSSTCAFQTITTNVPLAEGTTVIVFDVNRLPLTNKQIFIAEAGQTEFTVTEFRLTDYYIFVLDDMHQGTTTRNGQVVTLPFACNEGSKIIIYN